MKAEELKIPDKFKVGFFYHKVDDIWYLIPNEALTCNDKSESFKCWLFNSDGSLVTGISYNKTIEDLNL